MEFQNLGVHCAYKYCHLKDFLPFQCEGCKKSFCLEHRTGASHECEKKGGGDKFLIICPICLTKIKIQGDEDTNAIWASHNSSPSCKPQKYEETKMKEQEKHKKCPATGCHAKLGLLNSFPCKKCGQNLCSKHRYPDTHSCDPRAARINSKLVNKQPAPPKQNGYLREVGAPFGGNITQPTILNNNTGFGGNRTQTGAQPSLVNNPMTQMSRTGRTQAPAPGPPQVMREAPTGSEKCPLCGVVFPSLEGLIHHSELSHGGKGKKGPPPKPTEMCPLCKMQFISLNELIEHGMNFHQGQ